MNLKDEEWEPDPTDPNLLRKVCFLFFISAIQQVICYQYSCLSKYLTFLHSSLINQLT